MNDDVTKIDHRGFISIEIIAVLVIVLLSALFGADKYSEYLQTKEWHVAANQLQLFNNTAKSYISDNNDQIMSGTLPFRITPSLLKEKGYLNSSFSDANSFGQNYVTGVVKNSLSNSKSKLQALTCTTNGLPISEKGMRSIASEIQGLGGYISDKHQAIGAFGGWSSTPRDFGLDCRHGHMAIALSSEVLGTMLQESDRLYRFKVNHKPELNTMHTNINMGKNNIINANKIETDTIDANTGVFNNTVSVNGDVKSENGWFVTEENKGWVNNTYKGGFYMSDKEWIRAVNNKGIYTGGKIQGGSVHADGRVSAGEYLQLDKIVVSGTVCPLNGLISRDSKGAVLSCQLGVWTGIGIGNPWFSEKITSIEPKNIGSHNYCALAATVKSESLLEQGCILNRTADGAWSLQSNAFYGKGGFCQAVCF